MPGRVPYMALWGNYRPPQIELIKEIITKLSNLVPEQLESMSDELADAIVESVLGCEEMEDGDFEELWHNEVKRLLTSNPNKEKFSL